MHDRFRTSYPPTYPKTIVPTKALTVVQAMDAAPSLAKLAATAKISNGMLTDITPLLPNPLRSGVLAGGLEEGQWCLLAANSAVAAKLRQLSPALLAHLRSQGHAVETLRIKISTP